MLAKITEAAQAPQAVGLVDALQVDPSYDTLRSGKS